MAVMKFILNYFISNNTISDKESVLFSYHYTAAEKEIVSIFL